MTAIIALLVGLLFGLGLLVWQPKQLFSMTWALAKRTTCWSPLVVNS